MGNDKVREWKARELIAADDPETKLTAIAGNFSFTVVLNHDHAARVGELLGALQFLADKASTVIRAHEKRTVSGLYALEAAVDKADQLLKGES